MRYVFRMKHSGAEVIWEDGKVTAKGDIAQKIEDYNEAVKGSGRGMGTSGPYFASYPSADYLKTAAGAYLLLNSIEPTEVIEGNLDGFIKRMYGKNDGPVTKNAKPVRAIDKVIYRVLTRLSVKDADDAEEWRSDEDGRHFKIETKTGEIKAGFGGKLNGEHVKTVKTEPEYGSKPEPEEMSLAELFGWDDPNSNTATNKQPEPEENNSQREDYGQNGLLESEYPENLRLTEAERKEVYNVLRGYRESGYKGKTSRDLEQALSGWGKMLARNEEQYKKQLAQAEEMIKQRQSEGYNYGERHKGETGEQRKAAWWRYYNEHGEAPEGVGQSGIRYWQEQRKRAQEGLAGLALAKKVAEREEFARGNSNYMPWRKNPNNENQEYRPWAQDAMPDVVSAEDIEDGGPGSGNWGHKGRPGLVGGSGKGGGAHYRGGRSDIMYVSTKHDWLNGLSGERQREVSNWLKHVGGGDIEAGAENVMRYGKNEKRLQLIGYMAEARNWDDNSQYYYDNLTEEEGEYLDHLLNKLHGGTLNDMLMDIDSLSFAEQRSFADLMAKAMGGPTSGEPPIPDKKNIAKFIADMEQGGHRNALIHSLNSIAGKPHYRGPGVTEENIREMLDDFSKKAFSDDSNATYTEMFIEQLGDEVGFAKQFRDASHDPNVDAMKELFKKYKILPACENAQILGMQERDLQRAATEKEWQMYLSNKYQFLGGQPLTITAMSMADRKAHAEEIAEKRKSGSYAGNPDGDFAQKMKDQYAKANAMVTKCQDAACVKVWDGFEDKLRVLSTTTTENQHYSSADRGIYIDVKQDMTEYSIYAEGEVVFHESAHMIDHMIGLEKGLGVYYTTGWNNGEFLRTMHEEVKDWVKTKREELKSELAKAGRLTLNKDNILWLRQNGYLDLTWELRQRLQREGEGGEIKLLADNLNGGLAKWLDARADEPGKKYSTICDVVQGCTRSAVHPKIGHKVSYYAGSDHEEATGREAFAGLYAAAFTNPAANEAFKEVFPKTYATYERMIADVYDGRMGIQL